MKAIKDLFPGCEPYEIHTFLRNWSEIRTEGSKFFHINSDVEGDGKSHWKIFKEKHAVYTGEKSVVKKPKKGDIILVRFGGHKGCGIGVVEENDYEENPGGWSDDKSISIYWINKESRRIGDKGLGEDPSLKRIQGKRVYNKIREAYKDTFHLIEYFIKKWKEWEKERKEEEKKWKEWEESEEWEWEEDETEQSQSDSETESQTKEMNQTEESGIAPLLNTILFGPPGTGKTWETISHAVALIDGEDPSKLVDAKERDAAKKRFDELRESGQIQFVTFHQNYAYEDFIEGIRPVLDENELAYELRDGIFKGLALRAGENESQRYVLIIDEINRGNIAKIFGELITLIEPSKRLGGEDETKAKLPYSQEWFGVPSNLHILGTMNTADRGIALLDTALRRRFHFIERMPNPELVEKDIEGVDGQALLKAINQRIRAKLDREHQIGHTYFMGKTSIKELADAFQHQIMPLLQECFYDDWEKIRFVLNENPFVKEEPSPAGDGDSERPLLEVLSHDDEQWRQAESYQNIYKAEKGEPDD